MIESLKLLHIQTHLHGLQSIQSLQIKSDMDSSRHMDLKGFGLVRPLLPSEEIQEDNY